MSLPSLAEVEHADWPSLKRICESLGLNPKGRNAVVRMRALDHVRRRTRAEPWRAERGHVAALLTRLGSPDLAESIWESTIQLDAPAPWVGIGESQLAGGLLTEATKSFDRAVQMGDASAWLHRAEALAAGADFDRAAQACESYLGTNPGDLRALSMKASFLARAGFAEESVRILQATAESHPEIAGLSRTAGIVLLKTGRPEPAVRTLHDALRTDPRDVEALTNRGVALLLVGRTREAVGALREALELDPGRAEALNDLGVAYLQLSHSKSAGVSFERAAKHLESPRILLNLAKFREGAREREDALRAVEQVLRMRPNDPEALAIWKRLAPAASSRPPRRKAADRPTRARRTAPAVRRRLRRKGRPAIRRSPKSQRRHRRKG